MSEFGHLAAIGGGVCLDRWGAGPFLIVAENRKTYRFEDSDRFGPNLCNKRGDPTAHPWPGEKSPFWRAHFLWVNQGRKVGPDGYCEWREPKPTLYRITRRRQIITVEQGEPHGREIEVKP